MSRPGWVGLSADGPVYTASTAAAAHAPASTRRVAVWAGRPVSNPRHSTMHLCLPLLCYSSNVSIRRGTAVAHGSGSVATGRYSTHHRIAGSPYIQPVGPGPWNFHCLDTGPAVKTFSYLFRLLLKRSVFSTARRGISLFLRGLLSVTIQMTINGNFKAPSPGEYETVRPNDKQSTVRPTRPNNHCDHRRPSSDTTLEYDVTGYLLT